MIVQNAQKNEKKKAMSQKTAKSFPHRKFHIYGEK